MSRKQEYRSVVLTKFFMKIVGLWKANSQWEKLLMQIAFWYAIAAISFAIAVELVDLVHCRGDFYAVTDNLCATLLLVMILVKMGNFVLHRDLLNELISYAEKKFWMVNYDGPDAAILNEYDKRGIFMTYTFTFIVHMGAFNYIVAPLAENIGKNETDRVLPFKLWVNLPVTTTPYYEVTYTIQSLSTYHAGICTFCFDNFICTFNIHAAAQLKILAHKIEIMADRYASVSTTDEEKAESLSSYHDELANSAYRYFGSCIRDHLALISFIERMERAFTVILLGQLLLSSVVICFGGFQILAAETLVRKFIYSFIFIGGLAQLLIYTWTCNDIITQSICISDAAYNSNWYLLPLTEVGMRIRRGLVMIIMRARKPCSLRAGPFAIMSLEVFTSILSTAMSYFTLLRQMSEKI